MLCTLMDGLVREVEVHAKRHRKATLFGEVENDVKRRRNRGAAGGGGWGGKKNFSQFPFLGEKGPAAASPEQGYPGKKGKFDSEGKEKIGRKGGGGEMISTEPPAGRAKGGGESLTSRAARL